MAGQRYMNIPREKIPWYPNVDSEQCVNCGECVEFCSNEVFEKGETTVLVAKPYSCVVGCTSCARVCDAGAISFPTQEELKDMLRQLREKRDEETSTAT